MIASNYYVYKNEFRKKYKEDPITCERYLDSYYLKFNGQLDNSIQVGKVLIIIGVSDDGHFNISWGIESNNPTPLSDQIDLLSVNNFIYGMSVTDPLIKSRLKLVLFDIVYKLHKQRKGELLKLRHQKFIRTNWRNALESPQV